MVLKIRWMIALLAILVCLGQFAGNASAAPAPDFDQRLQTLESGLETKSMHYAELIDAYAKLIDDVKDYCAYSVNYEYSKNNRKRLLDSAENGLKKAGAGARQAYVAEADAIVADAERDLNSKVSAQDVFKKYTERRQALYKSWDGINFSYNLVEEVGNKLSAMEERINQQIIHEKRQVALAEIEQLTATLNSASSPVDIEELVGVMQVGAQKYQTYTQKEFEDIRSTYHSLQNQANFKINRICKEASRSLCDEALPNLDPKYRNHLVITAIANDSVDVRLVDFICALNNRGMFKKFKAGGMFSNDITLEFENGTIFFDEVFIDADTKQEVGSSYKGNAIKILVARELVSKDGSKTPFRKAFQEMSYIMLQLGTSLAPPECSR